MGRKELIHAECLRILADKAAVMQSAWDEMREAAANDTKSTAGDKHETSRAMMQIEQDRLGKQMQDLQHQRALLSALHPSEKSEDLISGSLVLTSKGWFYMAIPLGKVSLNDEEYFIVSPQSPIGQQLLHKKVGSSFKLMNADYTIVEIL
jgi:hypothetical protein